MCSIGQRTLRKPLLSILTGPKHNRDQDFICGRREIVGLIYISTELVISVRNGRSLYRRLQPAITLLTTVCIYCGVVVTIVIVQTIVSVFDRFHAKHYAIVKTEVLGTVRGPTGSCMYDRPFPRP